MLSSGTKCDQFVLEKMLSVGGFGQIFEAEIIGNSREKSVVKVEAQTAMFQLLFNECACLKSLNAAYNPNGLSESTPFLRFHGYGTIDGYRWLAMEKCGDNLSDLRKATPLNRFSVPTSLFILSKFIEALQMMHSIGWLHRDVKPANICLGLHSPRHLYLLDFGMSRIYVEKDGTLKPRRISAPFRGTLRYVSVNIHRRQDASRWDDIWSAFYIATENMVGFLPWRRMGDTKKVEDTKVNADLANLKYGSESVRPACMSVIENWLNISQTSPSYFYQPPPYELMIREIENDLHLRGYKMSSVILDWMTVQYPPTHQYSINPFSTPNRRKILTPQKTQKKFDEMERKYERSVCFY
uniref:Protein kinase domain-containing protein n=1 Tax=Caenorhabditis tropicalis TaxID=1561998 RepID=A0A1I7UCR9_9PELO